MKTQTSLLVWVIAGLLAGFILIRIDLHTDDLVGLLQAILIFGLLGIAILSRSVLVLSFWLALIQWLRRKVGRGD